LVLELYNKIKSNSFFKGVLIIAGGSALSQVISVLFAPIITRIYSPEDFGILTAFMAVVTVIGSVATLRYSVAIPIAKDTKEANSLLSLSFLVVIALTLILIVISYFFGSKILHKASSSQLLPFIYLIPLAFFFKGIYVSLNNWALRNKYFKRITSTRITQTTTGVGIKIALGLLNFKPIGLLLGSIFQEAAGISNLFIKLVKDEPKFFKKCSWSDIIKTAKRFKKFPLYQTWSQLLLSFGGQIPVLFIGWMYGAKELGLFGLANSMINIPMNLISSSVSQVYYAEIGKIGKDNPTKIYKLSLSIVKKLFWIGIIPVGVLIAFGPYIFSLVFGFEWREAGVYAQIISMLILFRLVSGSILSTLNVLELQRKQFLINALRIISIAVIFLTCKYIEADIYSTIFSYVIFLSLFRFFLIIHIFSLLKKRVADCSVK
jgi:O-antigen/teichoic acid export membrane protein